MRPLVITAAVVGAETMREDTPYVPYTPEDIAEEAVECRDAGANVVHLHGRLEDGTPTQSKEVFAQIQSKIDKRCNILQQFSTGGAAGMSVEERIDAIPLQPDMATLTTGTINFGETIFENALPTIREIARKLNEYNITPEIEIFDSGMVDTALRLADDGLLQRPLHFDFVMGMPGGIGGKIRDLEYLLSLIPDESSWSVAGLGPYELPLAREAIRRGGHVRVGLEDNIYIEKGVLAEGNRPLVEKVVEFAREENRPIASPAQAREILRLEE